MDNLIAKNDILVSLDKINEKLDEYFREKFKEKESEDSEIV